MNQERSYLVLAVHLEQYFGSGCREIEELYKRNSDNIIYKLVRKFMLSVPIFPKKIWLGSWIKDCKNKK